MARMDSNRTAEDFYRAHEDWFARTADGTPYRAADKYIACINSAYYDEYLPDVLREIIQRSHPEGFTDNSWAGMGRNSICFCDNCERKFQEKTGRPFPAARIGTTLSTANGFCGTMRAARNSGIQQSCDASRGRRGLHLVGHE